MIRTAAAAGLGALLLAGCSGGDGGTPATSSASLGPATSTSAPPEPSAPASESTTASPTAEPTLGPTIDTSNLAAFQLCGTGLALAAGFVGQVAPEQLAEGKAAVAAARAEYADDGSGLLQIVDALVAAVEDADSAAVITTAQQLGEACKAYTPGT